MALDIVGPSTNAPNVITTRPADTRVFGADDTWFKDCTPGNNDGTKVQAGFLNGMIAQVRKLIRGNGLNASSQNIVTEDNTDDFMMLRAIWHLIQRAQPTYADGVGSGNAVTIAPTPACNEYVKGLTFRIKWPADCAAGAVTVAASGLPPVNVVRTSGANPIAGDLVKNMIVEVTYDGSKFQIMGSPPNVLAAPRTYYVNGVTGNDTTGDGLTPSTAFATIQKGVNAAAIWNLNGFSVTVSVADYSNYAPVTLPAVNGTGTIVLVGNVANPDNVAIPSPAGSAVKVFGGPYVMSGFKVSSAAASGGDPGSGVLVSGNGATITLNAMAYGACVGSHIESSGNCGVNGPSFIRGGAQNHMLAEVNGSITLNPQTPPALTISAAVAFSTAFASSLLLGVLYAIAGYSSITGAANVTGSKFAVNQNGIIAVNGLGDGYFPGTSAGSRSSGGQYN
jgi:hypothetical protein